MNKRIIISYPIELDTSHIFNIIVREGGGYIKDEYKKEEDKKAILSIDNSMICIYKEGSNIIIERNEVNLHTIKIIDKILSIIKNDIITYYTDKFSMEVCDMYYTK